MTLLQYGTPVREATGGPFVDDLLTAELRMLCRGLAYSSLPFLATVRTVVRLPGDEEGERALRQTCGELAAEFGLESAIDRDGDAWAVCFSRPVEDMSATTAGRAWAGRVAGLLARLARSWEALRPTRSAQSETGR